MARFGVRLASLALVTLLAATPAAARIYYVVQSGPDDWTVMDPEGVEAVGAGPVRKAWMVRVQRNILAGDPPQPGYVRTLTEYDCVASRTRWREFSAYSRSGGLLLSKVNPNPEWGPASDASDTYSAYRMVCERASGGSVVSAESVAKVVIRLMGSWDPPAAALAPVLPPAPAKPAPTRPAPTRPAPTKPAPTKPAAKAR